MTAAMRLPDEEPRTSAPPAHAAAAGAEGRIGVLDGWRALSALMVVASHLLNHSSVRGTVPYAHVVQYFGGLGVEIFFAISGYIICRGMLAELARDGHVSLAAFYTRRVFRILPPLLLYVAVVYALAVLGLVTPDAHLILRVPTFTCDVAGADCGGWLGAHTWSLSVEEQFYLVIPLSLAAFGPWRRGALTTVAAGLPLAVLALYALHRQAPAVFLGYFITIGLGVAWALNERPLRAMVRRAPKGVAPLACAAVVFITNYNNTAPATATHVLLYGPLIVFVLMRSIETDSRTARLLSAAPLRQLGLVSYSLYLWQMLATYPFPGRGWGFYALAIPLCIAFSFASFYSYERPLIAFGRRLSRRLRLRVSRVAAG